MFRIHFKLLLITLVCFGSGCTKENMDDCFSGLKLRFYFTLNKNGENLFGPDIQNIRVYIFGQDSVLRTVEKAQGTLLTNNYTMQIGIDPGKYTIIAWGGSNEDFFNSYHDGHMNDAATHNYENGVIPGKTKLEDFRVFLNYGIAENYPEDIMPVIDGFDDLYYGAVGRRNSGTSEYVMEQVEVKAGTIVERNVELIKNTNTIHITISGIEYLRSNVTTFALSEEALTVWISGRNGRYKYDNSIGEYARMLRYFPMFQRIDSDIMLTDVKIMRLDMKRHIAEPLYLTMQNPVTGATFPEKPIDIVNTLLQARNPDTGEYIYNNQEDFDREDEHPIELRISADLSVRIFIKGWEIINLKPEI